MRISYHQRFPDPASVYFTEGRTVRREDPETGELQPPRQRGKFIVGSFRSGKSKDVCIDYYRQRGRRPPYLELVNWGSDDEAIKEFTQKFGPLGAPLLWESFNPLEPLRAYDFIVDLEGWRKMQTRFRMLMDFARRKKREEFRRLLNVETRPGHDRGGMSITVEVRRRNVSDDLVKPKLMDLGLEFQIVPGSLYGAFVEMLALDVVFEGRMVRRCANLECDADFVTDRLNKIYCKNTCAVAVAHRNYSRRRSADRAAARVANQKKREGK